MLAKILARLTGAAFLVMTGLAGAQAQNYDGAGLIKFGVFGQGMFINVDQELPTVASASPSGFGGGVSAGYDWNIAPHWLIGLELEGSFGDARDRADLTDYGFDYLLALKGRIGVYARPDWLIYATAGVGFLGTEQQRPGIGNKMVDTMTGFVGGIGTEIDWHHVILFSEYLYGNFGDREFSIGALRHDASFDAHLVRLGIKFKVGHDHSHSYDHPDHHRRHDTLK